MRGATRPFWDEPAAPWHRPDLGNSVRVYGPRLVARWFDVLETSFAANGDYALAACLELVLSRNQDVDRAEAESLCFVHNVNSGLLREAIAFAVGADEEDSR